MAVVSPVPPPLATKIYQNNVARDFAKVHNGDVLGNVVHNEKHYKAYVLQARRSVLIEPSERIGAIACVAGLKDLVSKIQARLASSGSRESLPSGLKQEIQSSNTALNELHEQFQATNRPDDFSTLITCRQALTSSTNAVKLFDELYSAVLRIGTEDALTPLSLALFIEKLQWQTTVWQLQINILQSTSTVEASRNSRELHKNIENRLSLDLELERRVKSIDTDMVQIMSEIDEAMLDFQRRSVSEHENNVDLSTNRMSLNFEELSTALDVSQTHATKGLISSLRFCCNLAALTLPSARNQLVLCRTRLDQNEDNGNHHVYQIAIDHCDLTIASCRRCATRLQDLAFEDDARQQDQVMAMAQELLSAWAQFATEIRAVAGKQLDIGNLKQQLRPLHNALKGLGRGQLHQTTNPAQMAEQNFLNDNSGTLRWSGLSELTLADTAVMSIMTLPLFVSELKHGSFYERDIEEDYPSNYTETKTALRTVPQTKEKMMRSLVAAARISQVEERGGASISKSFVAEGRWSETEDGKEVTVDLAHTRLGHLPVPVIELMCDNLSRLALSHNTAIQLPPEISLCRHLKYLNLRWNHYREFPLAICEVTSLEILDISKNFIEEIPESIGQLKALRFLAFAQNKVEKLPAALTELDKMVKIKLDDNPVEKPLLEYMQLHVDDFMERPEGDRHILQCRHLKDFLQTETFKLNFEEA